MPLVVTGKLFDGAIQFGEPSGESWPTSIKSDAMRILGVTSQSRMSRV